jgi:hypothetical protein
VLGWGRLLLPSRFGRRFGGYLLSSRLFRCGAVRLGLCWRGRGRPGLGPLLPRAVRLGLLPQPARLLLHPKRDHGPERCGLGTSRALGDPGHADNGARGQHGGAHDGEDSDETVGDATVATHEDLSAWRRQRHPQRSPGTADYCAEQVAAKSNHLGPVRPTLTKNWETAAPSAYLNVPAARWLGACAQLGTTGGARRDGLAKLGAGEVGKIESCSSCGESGPQG